MTREQMLVEIEEYRDKGHTVSIHGAGANWMCQFDRATGQGSTPMEAYQTARAAHYHAPDISEEFEPKKLGGSSQE